MNITRQSRTRDAIRAEMDANSAKLANLDATVSSRGTGTALDAAGRRHPGGRRMPNFTLDLRRVSGDTWQAQVRVREVI